MKLSTNNITMKYGNFLALDDFKYNFTNGVYGLVGANGAGKTTLMQIIAGILSPNKGTISIDDIIWDTKKPAYGSFIGYLPQEISMYNNFTVQEFLYYVSILKTGKRIKSDIDNLIDLLGLSDKYKTPCKKLSGGMKRRLGIAQALLNDPKILILDEPTTGIDIAERINFRQIITSMAESRIVIYSTHIMSDLELIAKEIIFLDKGKIILSGLSNDLILILKDSVCELDLTVDEFNNLDKKLYLATNICKMENGYRVRLIGNKLENKAMSANFVQANFEDLAVYVFHNKDIIGN